MSYRKALRCYIETWLIGACIAFVFLTRLPIPFPTSLYDKRVISDKGLISDKGSDSSMVWFPIVGLVVGSISALSYVVGVHLGMSNSLASIVAIMTLILLTGALHEDGLADAADGLGGVTCQEKYDIMHDSRIGSFGVIALIVTLGLRIHALSILTQPDTVAVVLISTSMASRAAMVAVAHWMTLAFTSSISLCFGRPSLMTMIIILAMTTLCTFFLLGWAMFAMVSAIGLGTWIVMRLAHQQIGGYTGDILGSVQQVSETVSLVTLACIL